MFVTTINTMRKEKETETAGELRDFIAKWRIPQPVLAEVSGIPLGSLALKLSEKVTHRHLSPADEEKLKEALATMVKEAQVLLK